jgi:hypothetical protein
VSFFVFNNLYNFIDTFFNYIYICFFDIKDKKVVLASLDEFIYNKLGAVLAYFVTYVYYRILSIWTVLDATFRLTYEILDNGIFTLALIHIAFAKMKSKETKAAIIFFVAALANLILAIGLIIDPNI